MCNCGNKRSQYNKTAQAARPVATPAPAASANPKIKFMYTGRSYLKINGQHSGYPYFFKYRGQILEVNPADSSFLMTIPELSMVKTG